MVLTFRRSAWWTRHFLVADIPVASMTVIDGGVNRNAASSRAPLAFRALAPTAWFCNFGKGGQSLNRQREGDKRMAVSVRCVKD
jgi:hypothetical protein